LLFDFIGLSFGLKNITSTIISAARLQQTNNS